MYPHDLNNKEFFSDLKDVTLFLKREKVNEKQMYFTPHGLLQYISSMGLEANKILATALKI